MQEAYLLLKLLHELQSQPEAARFLSVGVALFQRPCDLWVVALLGRAALEFLSASQISAISA